MSIPSGCTWSDPGYPRTACGPCGCLLGCWVPHFESSDASQPLGHSLTLRVPHNFCASRHLDGMGRWLACSRLGQGVGHPAASSGTLPASSAVCVAYLENCRLAPSSATDAPKVRWAAATTGGASMQVAENKAGCAALGSFICMRPRTPYARQRIMQTVMWNREQTRQHRER
jgi:hypothetical protein